MDRKLESILEERLVPEGVQCAPPERSCGDVLERVLDRIDLVEEVLGDARLPVLIITAVYWRSVDILRSQARTVNREVPTDPVGIVPDHSGLVRFDEEAHPG